MKTQNRAYLRHHWGLWYDRRSDDHQMVRRPDADVWPPFYEQPWLRSGLGKAWDGLSKYDLTKFNPWYFARIRKYAELAEAEGLLLVNEMYFQHNILEAGAHWASFPWRPANALQDTGFPEPPPYAGDKRVFVAEAFYDVSHLGRRELHRAYIRQCLENLRGITGVIHTLGAEYSGPLAFAEFWADVVAEWMRETGEKPMIAVSAPKDVQDALLMDPERSKILTAIDFTYWWRSETGLFAPAGGQNLAPRQHERQWKGGRPTARTLAQMVREYRLMYPGKAVITGLRQPDPWAFLAAGGSLATLPQGIDDQLLEGIPALTPSAETSPEGVLQLEKRGSTYLVYLPAWRSTVIDLPDQQSRYRIAHVDTKTGSLDKASRLVSGGQKFTYNNERDAAAVLWITRQ